ncbi:MAG: AraC family transcriptional regulator [Hyphomicrobiaceae bacterium]
MVRAGVASGLVQYLQENGVETGAFLEASGLHRDDISDPMAKVPLRSLALLFAAATRGTGDYDLPVRFAQAATAGVTGLVGHLAANAPTIREFLRSISEYAPLVVTGPEVGFTEKGGFGTFWWSTPADFDASLKHCHLFTIASIVARVRAAAGPGWVPIAVDVEHRRPEMTDAVLEVFGPKVRYDQDTTRIVFDAATLSRSMPGARPDLFAIFCNHANLLMREQSAEPDLVSQVTAIIGRRLSDTSISLATVARETRMSQRALQRRLELAGSSFEKLLDETRCVVADRMLRETDRPLSDIAFALGYSSQSTFTRAARRWFSLTPRAYRQRHRGIAPLAPPPAASRRPQTRSDYASS